MKFKNRRFISILGLSSLLTNMLYADISGVVFQDLPVNGTALNTYGIKDSNELGVEGITVTAYPDNISTITAADGTWSLATTTDSRIEFSNIPSYLKESFSGGTQNASVQLGLNGSTINLGLHNPVDYFSNSPLNVVTSVHSGSIHFGSEFVLVKFPETSGSSSTTDLTSYQTPTADVLAEEQEIGAIWGMGYDRNHEQMLSASFVKRFTRLGDGNPTTIYSVPVNGGSPTTWITLDSGRADPHGASPNWSEDFSVIGSVGKEGLGDLDIAEDGSEVYTIDMGTNEFIRIPINADGSAGTPVSVALPSSFADCSDNNDIRSMGLGVHNGKVYVGSVCSAESTVSGLPISNTTNRVGDPSKLRGYVHVWDGVSSFTEVLNFPLNYERGCLNLGGMGQCTDFGNAAWQAWTGTYPLNSMDGKGAHGYPQPMISDIEFNNDNMIIGLVDRFGHMDAAYASEPTGFTSGQVSISGDILHACKTGTDTWVMEKLISGDSSCSSGGLGYDANRVETIEEYYHDDDMGDIIPGNHADVGEGGLAVIPGRDQVLSSAMDPARSAPSNDPVTSADPWQSHGLHWYDDKDGSWLKGYVLVDEGQTDDQPNWGKGNGVGDVEVLLEPAPIEVGDRVWLDDDGDGVQDAGETGISGVQVDLVCGGSIVATATTDASGNYLFSNDASGSSTASQQYGITELIPGTSECLLRIPNIEGSSKQSALGENVLTLANTGEGVNSNLNDSDGSVIGYNAEVNVTATDIPVSGANNHSFDFGFTPASKANLGNYVWNDINKDGIQDSNESGVSGVVVKLYKDCAGTELNSTVTDANGNYLFSGLEEGDYCVGFELPNGYMVTLQDTGGDESKDSDVDSSTLKTASVTLSAGDNYLDLDMGIYYAKASIGDYVWLDMNQNGIQDSSENGVSGVTATLYRGDCRTEINTTVTDANGLYHFDNLDSDDYCVGFSNIPAGHAITTKEAVGSTAANNSDVDPTTSKTVMTHLDEGENDATWDMGIYPLASIGNYVWHDLNRNGVQEGGESGIAGVNISLLANCNESTVTGSTVTDTNGEYLFEDIVPGDYCVMFDLLAGYEVTLQGSGSATDSDVNATTMKTPVTTISPAEADMDWDMGLYQVASLGDKVWLDTNGNGLQDTNESGVSGVTVALLQNCDAAQIIDTKVTDSNGNYLFSDVVPGTYCVQFSDLPADHYVTVQDVGDDGVDSDVNPTTFKTIATTLSSGENDLSWDMGITELASLGNRVWLDSNANGIQESNETGVSNVKVTLYRDCDSSPTEVSNQYTDSNGSYLFTNLEAGNYCVEFTELPAGANITPQDMTDDSLDSDVDPATGRTITTTLTSGEQDLSWDMGIYYLASLGDRVWEDSNADGVQDTNESGVANVTVILYANDCTTELDTTVTDVDGKYHFMNLMPQTYCVGFTLPDEYSFTLQDTNVTDETQDSDVHPSTGKTTTITLNSGQNDTTWDAGIYRHASLGDFVWIDSNKNGLQESGEKGVSNVTVTLYQQCDSAAPLEINSTITDINGSYLFDGLVPNAYCVKFSGLPKNYYVTVQDSGSDDQNDSDANPTTKTTVNTILVSGEHDPSWDMGIYYKAPTVVTPPKTPEEPETPEEEETPEVPTKTCFGDRVWNDENQNGIQDSGEVGIGDITVTLYQADCTTEIKSVQTDSNGNYLFNHLDEAEYCVGVTVPTGYLLTSQDQGSDDTRDSDVDAQTGRSSSFMVVTQASCNISIDMGLYADETCVEARIYDDTIEANTNGATTVIDVLGNDAGQLNSQTIALLNIQEGETLWGNGTSVAGTNITRVQTLVVEGEGVWRVENGQILFTAQDGFEGVPTPIYYVVDASDCTSLLGEERPTNVAQVRITSECVCEPYETQFKDAVPALSPAAMLLLLLLSSGVFFLFGRDKI